MHAVGRRFICRGRAGAVTAAIACGASLPLVCTASASAASQAQRIDAVIRSAIKTDGLSAVLVQASTGRRIVIRKAYGQSMAGVPARIDMHFRNGNVAAMYMSTLLLRLVDQHKVALNDRVSKFLPQLRNKPNRGDGDRVTLGMLAGMTAGYHDYEQDPNLGDYIYGRPFAPVTTAQRLRLAFSRPIQFTPGSNFSYAHSDYVILGMALEKITRLPLRSALSRYVLGPLGLRNTRASQTAYIPPPVLHTYSSERHAFLGIPLGQPFLEETTFFNPAWTFANGAVETTTIADMTRSVIGIGTGKLLTRGSHRAQINPHIGFGHTQDGCEGCRTLSHVLGYGLGVFRLGSWIGAQPLFAGLGSVTGYLPSKRIAITIVVALGPRSFAADGTPFNYSKPLFGQITKILAPKDAAPG
jgi:CubicO group peptidase (beta-lactamase class C family)